ncbi:MAG: hypothetical protein ACREBR_02805, partial [bacterium]
LYGLDACHLSWGDCTLFSVYGLSSNDNTVCLSHAIISGNEDFDSWKIFMTFVKKCYPHLDMSHLAVVSDQDKGISVQ